MMTDADIEEAAVFFKPGGEGLTNCTHHPAPAFRRGAALVAEVRRLRHALARIARLSLEREESADTWRDIALAHERIAAQALSDDVAATRVSSPAPPPKR